MNAILEISAAPHRPLPLTQCVSQSLAEHPAALAEAIPFKALTLRDLYDDWHLLAPLSAAG
jgi:hypothetical protein